MYIGSIYLYTCIYIYKHTYIYIHTYTHTHTHTHTYIYIYIYIYNINTYMFLKISNSQFFLFSSAILCHFVEKNQIAMKIIGKLPRHAFFQKMNYFCNYDSREWMILRTDVVTRRRDSWRVVDRTVRSDGGRADGTVAPLRANFITVVLQHFCSTRISRKIWTLLSAFYYYYF